MNDRRKSAGGTWALVLAAFGLMVWARFGATPLGLAGFESLTLFPSSYLDPLPAVPPPPDTPALSQQVILIVLDGLRVDVSESLPTLNRLRAAGVDRTMWVGQPSYSLPDGR